MTGFIIALQTCDRREITQQTLDSLVEFNPHLADWCDLVYADDASSDDQMRPMIERYGFRPAVLHDTRMGCSRTLDMLARHITEHFGGDAIVVYLQNDFVSLRPIPKDTIVSVLSSGRVAWLRLSINQSRRSWRARRPFIGHFVDDTTGEKVNLVDYGCGYHVFAARASALSKAVRDARRERTFFRRTRQSGATGQLELPVFRHATRHSTPNGIFR